MSHSQTAPLQTPWDCRWTQFECRLSRKRRDPEILWVCIRDGKRRYVTEEECECCDNWAPSE